jgi:tetratricopeptide (TPR) repeat protein
MALLLLSAQCGPGQEPMSGPLVLYGFENATGNAELAIWNPWLTDMLVRDLWQADTPGVWSPQRGAAFRRGQEEADREAILAAARAAGAGTILFGTVAPQETGFRVTVDMAPVVPGAKSRSVSTTLTIPGELPDAMDRLRDAIWEVLEISPPEAVRSIRELTTADLEAYGEFVAGEILYSQANYDGALERYRRATRKDMDFAQAHHGSALALVAYAMLDNSAARNSITLAWAKREKAGERDRLAIEAFRALIYMELLDADESYSRLRDRFPGDKDQAYFHALTLSRLERLDEAIQSLEVVVEADPEFIPGWVALANMALVAGQQERAREAAAAALALDATEPGLVETAVALELMEGDLGAAEAMLEEAMADRISPSLVLAQGDLILLRGDVDGALENYIRVNSPLPMAMAEIYRGRVNAGMARLREVSDVQITHGNRRPAAVGLWFTGMVLARNGQPELAIEQHTTALNFGPSVLQNSTALAIVVARQGDLTRARQVLETMKETGPAVDPMGWEEQVLLLEGESARAEDDHDRAIQLLERARALARVRFMGGGFISDRPLVTEALAQAYLEKGELQQAERFFREIVEMAGDRLYWPWIWLEAHTSLAELAVRDGRVEEAEALADVVRGYWGAAGGQNQPMVDQALERLDRILPST